jgi:hypothetical protein
MISLKIFLKIQTLLEKIMKFFSYTFAIKRKEEK